MGRRLQVWVKSSPASLPPLVSDPGVGAGIIVCNSQVPSSQQFELHGIVINSGRRPDWQEELTNLDYSMRHQLKLTVSKGLSMSR